MSQGYYKNDDVTHRTIWVQRDDGILELKPWFIYTFQFIGKSADTIRNFIEREQKRYQGAPDCDPDLLKQSFTDYHDLQTHNPLLPPRLCAISADDLQKMDTILVTDHRNFTYGDSVGGIAPHKPESHNAQLQSELEKYDTILFNPGALARIIVEKDGIPYYIFQLSAKNLEKKAKIFYKPIGGHLKIHPAHYDELLKTYALQAKDTQNIHDSHDVSFTIHREHVAYFTDLFMRDILVDKNFYYFQDPAKAVLDELFEELGPVSTYDGIDLLDASDLVPITA